MKLHIAGLILLFGLTTALAGCDGGNTVAEPDETLSEDDQRIQEEMESEEYEQAMQNMGQ